MWCIRTAAVAVGLGLGVPAGSLTAQIDYRNLDREQPVATEDAYPVERHAFELLLPFHSEREQAGERVHAIPLEVEYGLLDNAQIGVGAPLAVVDPDDGGSETGLAGLSLSGLYNFNTEGPVLPAIAAGADVALPVGSLAGDEIRVGLKAIVTRSWGLTRLHLNATWSFGSEDQPGVEFSPRWSYGLAVDRTLYRSSLLLVGELLTQRVVEGAAAELNAAVGLRYQWTPTLVLSAGLARRLVADAGPDYALTVGLSRAFGLSWLMPGRTR